MRVLARREPTFGLHLHVGVDRAEDAIRVFNRVRAHLPLMLALSANSPFWQGRDTGMRSARTPLFQGFPRVGIPRAFESYAQWVEAVDVLLRCDAVPEPSFLWWDIRLQPRFGTVEIRVLDAQVEVGDTLALAALFQSVARLELERQYASKRLLESPEALSENRFLAARDGMEAKLLDPARDRRVPARELLDDLLEACAPYARDLGCADYLGRVPALARSSGAERQLSRARDGGVPSAMAELADALPRPPDPWAARRDERVAVGPGSDWGGCDARPQGCVTPAATSAWCAPDGAASSRSASGRSPTHRFPSTRACPCASAAGTSGEPA